MQAAMPTRCSSLVEVLDGDDRLRCALTRVDVSGVLISGGESTSVPISVSRGPVFSSSNGAAADVLLLSITTLAKGVRRQGTELERVCGR